MTVFKMPFAGYGVRFSPFYESRLAVATAQNFGIVGNGRLHVFDFSLGPAGGGIVPVASFDTADAVYDCAWSENNDGLLVAAVADGSVKLYDLNLPPAANPLRSFHEHSREIHSVDWNPVRKDSFLSASWDDSIKLWTLDRGQSVRTFKGHDYCVYSVAWSLRHADVLASASGDCTLRLWDVREPNPTHVIAAHEFEVLACDWDKYSEVTVVTGSVDKSIRVWDVRSFQRPVTDLLGHRYAVRRLRCSPHRPGVVVSCSYDMSVRLWDYRSANANPLLSTWDHHTEFAVGVDISVLVDGLVASTGWDDLLYVWPIGTDPKAP